MHPNAAPVLLRDYTPFPYRIESVEMIFTLRSDATRVASRLAVRRLRGGEPLRLDGEDLTLLAARIDGEEAGDRLAATGTGLILSGLPEKCVIDIETEIDPAANTTLSGLYLSGGAFFTQCEAEGFRRITYFPDRPDVMSRYTVTLLAERERCPVLLSNGNPVDRGEGAPGWHWAKWEDPHPKPSYLFALVAGDLEAVRDAFTTASGRHVDLAIWVRAGDEGRCGHAMAALKAAMRWDEETFGLEYDLDVYNIAAVSDFNMGAMENKGLNVFNTRYVLADPATATDGDYQGIETVIAHEYFHNWTGNRVTCRDWFQLSLKEGLTVFRDQQFGADRGGAAAKRLGDVRALRAGQFREDRGPLAHPVRPDSYVKIDNFYTATVYQKGAEVVRMIHTLIGAPAFRRGMDLYIARHDNSAATIEDFVAAMRDASGRDLSSFFAWYDQAGTPDLRVKEEYDAAARRYTLHLSQHTPPTPRQTEKRPAPIPVAMGLLDPAGAAVPLRLSPDAEPSDQMVLLLDGAEARFTFHGVAEPPTPSLLRGFSAPVALRGLDPRHLPHLAAHDPDPYVRWDSGQQVALGVLLPLCEGLGDPEPGPLETIVGNILRDVGLDPTLAALGVVLPGEVALAAEIAVPEPTRIHHARREVRRRLAAALADDFAARHHALASLGEEGLDAGAIGRRALRNACLAYLSLGEGGAGLAERQFREAGNMTDSLAALSVLSETDRPGRDAAFASFFERWRHDDLVLDKWFSLQASSSRLGAPARVAALLRHPLFAWTNPNRVRATLGGFMEGNPLHFHDPSGAGYRLAAEAIARLDRVNGQIAARMTTPLCQGHRQTPERRAMMEEALRGLAAEDGLSAPCREIVERGLRG